MTTIAVRDGIMAADSKCTDEFGAFCTRIAKVYRLSNKALLGCAGDADCRDVVALLNNATPKKLPSRAEIAALKMDFSGLLLFPNGSLFYIGAEMGDKDQDATGEIVECKERFAAVGSGQQFAIGAMAAGYSARKAVEVAARYDTATGMPVTEHVLKPTEKDTAERVPKTVRKPKVKA